MQQLHFSLVSKRNGTKNSPVVYIMECNPPPFTSKKKGQYFKEPIDVSINIQLDQNRSEFVQLGQRVTS